MISINIRDPRPIYAQVRDGVRRLIVTGVLPADSKLPSVREMATGLTINPNTIQRAYSELEDEGYICTIPGKGCYVCDSTEILEIERKKAILDSYRNVLTELKASNIPMERLTEILQEVYSDDKDD